MPLNPNPSEPFAVTCDSCDGHMFIGHELCPKCNGEGRILITPINNERRVTRMWNWLRRQLGIAGWQERRIRQRRDEARCNMGIYDKHRLK